MDKKDLGKNLLKGGGKAIANTAKNNIGNGTSGADETARDAQKVVDAAKSTAKTAAKAAAGDWAGAVKEFLKNPTGVLTTVLAPLLVLILVVVCVMSVLVNSVWNAVLKKPVSSVVDEYIDDLNYAESNCFYKACEEVSDKALAEIKDKVLAIDLKNETLNKTKKETFKDKETLQQNLGTAYNQMRQYASNGNSYSLYHKVLMGEAKIFPLLEDNSTGFEVAYNSAGLSNNTTWTRTTHIIDFNNNEKTYEKYVKRYQKSSSAADFESLQAALDGTEKVSYNFYYNNERVNDSGYTFSMFEMMFNEKYDFDKYKEVNGEDGLATRLTAQIEKLNDLLNKSGSLPSEELTTQLNLTRNQYDFAGADAYYLDPSVAQEFNLFIDRYNQKFLKDAEEKDKKQYVGQDEAFANNVLEAARQKRKKAFKDFLGNKDFYSKLLTYNVSVDLADNTTEVGTGQSKFELRFSDAKSTEKDGKITVQNIKKVVNIKIDVDICDYDTLAELFGYKTRDENGQLQDNVELLDWIVKGGREGTAAEKERDSKDANNSNASSKTTSESTNSSNIQTVSQETSSIGEKVQAIVDANTILWPLDIHADGIAITSKFGSRDNPLASGSNENHKGLDIGAPMGTPVAAALPGKVISSRYSQSYGNVVEIESEIKIGDEIKTVQTLYAHMSSRTATQGMTITRGENLIGYVGSTGNSTGPHLHFEIKIKQDDGTFKNVDPEAFLNGDTKYYLHSSAVSSFDGTLNSFFDNCKDSGAASAAVLTDAGYTRSSTYWQFKNNTYNVMFCSSVDDSTKLPFFVDKENIVKNDDGSLKIVEYNSANFDTIDFSLGSNVSKAQDSSVKYNKKYYAVYCYPNTVVQSSISAYRTNLNYERMKNGQTIKDWFYGNRLGQTVGGLNYMVSELPYNYHEDATDSVAVSLREASEKMAQNEKDKKNAVSMKPYSEYNYNCDDFSYLSYCFANISYGFEVLNLQVSVPDGNGNEHFLTANDYNNNLYGVFHLNKTKMSQTVTEKFKADDKDSDFQMAGTIMGNVLNENYYPKDWKSYKENDTSTYPYFVVSVADIHVGDHSGLEVTAPSLYDVFDLDVVGDKAYNDIGAGKTWPLVKSYEHTNDVYPLFSGTIKSVDRENSQIVVSDALGSDATIKNIIPADECAPGLKFTASQKLGTIADGMELAYSGSKLDKKGNVISENPMNAGEYFKIEMNISARSEMSMVEDADGKYNKVLSMLSGYIVSADKTHIKVKSDEENLCYEYSGLVVDNDLLEEINFQSGQKIYLSNGTEVGKLYLTDKQGKANHLSVLVYREGSEFSDKVQYFSPANYFNLLSEASTAARKILIQNASGKTLSGIVLNRGESLQLKSAISPDSAKGAKVKWQSSNPGLVSVDSNGKITAAKDKYGTATISCTFDDGKDGVGGTCVVNVPEKLVDISITCANGHSQTAEGTIAENLYDPCTLSIVDKSEKVVVELILDDNGKAIADFNAYTTNLAAMRSVNWSIVMNGKENSEYATIDKNGTVTAKKAMTASQKLFVRATAADKIGDATYVEVAIRIVQPLKQIKINPTSMEFLLNNKNVKSQNFKYTYEPANATYKDVKVELKQTGEKIFELKNLNKNSCTGTISPLDKTGAAYLQITSTKYSNIGATCEIKASMLVDRVKITQSPKGMVSGERYQFAAKAYYKGKEVSLNSDGVDIQWSTGAVKNVNCYVNGAFAIDDSGKLVMPQIFGEHGTVKVIATVTASGIATKAEVEVPITPFLYFFAPDESSSLNNIYHISKDQKNWEHQLSSFTNAAIAKGKEMTILDTALPNNMKYEIIPDANVYVENKGNHKVIFKLRNGVKEGVFKVKLWFDGEQAYERSFYVR